MQLDFVTSGSVEGKKPGIRICSPKLGFPYSVRLLNYTPIIEMEFIATILALHRIVFGYTKLLIFTDSPSVCDTMGEGCRLSHYKELRSLVPEPIAEVRFI